MIPIDIVFLEPGERRESSYRWIDCLPGVRIRVWSEGAVYSVEYVQPESRSLVERSLLADVLAESSGIVLHSSALLDGESAWLFVGRSGVGKSTIAHNAYGRLLSDDTVLIRRTDSGKLRVSGTPYGKWGGEHDSKQREIAGICFLDQSSEVTIGRAKHSDALSKLFAALFLPPTLEGEDDPRIPKALAETLMDLFASTPCYTLAVPLGYRFNPKDIR